MVLAPCREKSLFRRRKMTPESPIARGSSRLVLGPSPIALVPYILGSYVTEYILADH